MYEPSLFPNTSTAKLNPLSRTKLSGVIFVLLFRVYLCASTLYCPDVCIAEQNIMLVPGAELPRKWTVLSTVFAHTSIVPHVSQINQILPCVGIEKFISLMLVQVFSKVFSASSINENLSVSVFRYKSIIQGV